jgi:hypothetical protein
MFTNALVVPQIDVTAAGEACCGGYYVYRTFRLGPQIHDKAISLSGGN